MNRVFDRIEDAETRRAAYVHSYGVSQCCVLLALKRGLDPELAAVIGLLHDIYSYKTGLTALHSENGADMVRVVFKRDLRDLFSEDEQTIIKSAIYHHSDKGHVHDEYDELLKDSDVLFLLSFRTSYDGAPLAYPLRPYCQVDGQQPFWRRERMAPVGDDKRVLPLRQRRVYPEAGRHRNLQQHHPSGGQVSEQLPL